MKKAFLLIFVSLSLLFLATCQGPAGADGVAGIDGTDGTDGIDGSDGSDGSDGAGQGTEGLVSYSMSGYGQDGPYPYGSLVTLMPLTSDLNQLGTGGFMTFTNSDFGSYARDFSFPGQYVEAFIQGNPFDELTGQLMSFKALSAIIDLSDDTEKNINPSTTMRTPILKYLFNNDNSSDAMPGRYTDSRDEAETRILSCFSMPSLGAGEHFENMDITQTDKVDAVGLAISTILLGGGRTVAEQLELMQIISGQLKNGSDCELSTKNQLRSDGAALDVVQIRNNLESRYQHLGHQDYKAPQFYNHLDFDEDGIRNDDDPDSYVEILTEIHEIKWHKQLSNTCSTTFPGGWGTDPDGFKHFAFPHVFDPGISTSKYISFSANADYMQIYSVNTMGTSDTSDDEPLAPLAVFSGAATTVSKIPVNYLTDSYLDASDDSYGNMPSGFQAVITGNTIPIGAPVFIVLSKDVNYLPTNICYGGAEEELSFGRNQQSADGVTWQNKLLPGPIFTHNLLRSAGLD